MRKIINDPQTFVDDVIDGILMAHGDELRAVTDDRRAIVARDAGAPGRVGIITGGGSGHLPLFLGFVGEGLATGVAVGNVFSSPSAGQICAATVAADGGVGVLYLYGNYGGDVFNFDAAAEEAGRQAVRTRTVLGTDDILSAERDRMGQRRGVAGLFFALKTAGAAAARGRSLDEVADIAQRTVDRTRTMGVGLAPTILPATGQPSFHLADGEMEIGIGIHGEPGRHRGPLETADQIAERFMTEILGELTLQRGDRVAVLVNGLGATPLEEQYLIYRFVHAELAERGVSVFWRHIGELVTSLEMAGASLSILQLDDELADLIDAHAHSPFFDHRAGRGERSPGAASPLGVSGTKSIPVAGVNSATRTVRTPGPLRSIMIGVAERLPDHADELRRLDSALGDGDLGLTIGSGARAVRDALVALPDDAHPEELMKAAGRAFSTANPSTYAALMGGALTAMAVTLSAVDVVDAEALRVAVQVAQQDIMRRGHAELGDKTVVDVLDAVRATLADQTGSTQDRADRAARVAAEAVSAGAGLQSRRGRAAWLGERSRGEVDPGSRAMQRIVEELAAVIRAL